MTRRINKNKRSQHEIVGFVLIVVIVVVIGLFLLVWYLRQPAVETESLDVQNFLKASMLYTTSCYLTEPLDLQDLIKKCHRNEMCSGENGKMACDVLNDELPELVHKSWLVSPDKPVKAYSLNVYYAEKDENEEGEEKEIKKEILSLQEGNCTGSKVGAEHFFQHESGNIYVTMEICYV